MRKKVYTGPTCTARFLTGWNCHFKVKGKKFYEAFWGIIQVLDLDPNEDRMIVSPNFMTWLQSMTSKIRFLSRRQLWTSARFHQFVGVYNMEMIINLRM